MKKRFSLLSIAVFLSSAVALSGCLATGGAGGSPEKAASGDPGNEFAAPSSFLRSGYGPLSEWLDGRYDVTYRNMRLGGSERENIFAQRPIERVHYRFEDIARSGALFELRATNISRREILYQIARMYDLRMSIEDVNGKPAYIRVKGNQRGSRFDPAPTAVDDTAIREL